ncbi:MMPL family transporter [Streptomyces sp. NBC_01408]|uniref:MMPL family transporter n=1 Tax=Streptomyces sp. NBC_01408 TaxID=2903855 RepID=UPI0022578A1C|nr:MMPL family transporter [Streptomyces sp. NBC_01408]MCX4695174.1 MMPL family transporter [Streptomyces sp. NBC_01408]MCX4695181.1 MMPL family transporter [Streptomyces sp. NBC_01408]
MIRALTGYSTRRPWKVIAVWAVLGIALTFLGQALVHRVTQSSGGDFLPPAYDSAAALQVAEEKFGVKPGADPLTVLVARADGAPLADADERRIDEEAAALARYRVVMPPSEDDLFFSPDHSQVPRVSPAMTAPDRSFRLLSVELTGNSQDPRVHDTYRAFREHARAEFAEAGLRTGFTGGLADGVDTADAGKTRSLVIGILMLGAIVLLHVLVFRSLLASLLPLLVVSVVGGAATGTVVGAAALTGIDLDPSTPQLINVVLVGIGIDYFLFLLFRFREQLRRRPDQSGRSAACEVAGRVGTAVTSAALTIVAAFATLAVASFGQFRVLGPAIAVSVLVMLLGSLTLMPALLAVTGRRMFWPSRSLEREPRGGSAGRLGDRVARRPVAAALACVALLGALAAGTAGIRMDYGPGDTGGERTASAVTSSEIARALPAGVSDPISVFVTAPEADALGDGGLGDGGLGALAGALGKVDGVGRVAPAVLSEDRLAARIDLFPNASPHTQEARDLASGPVRETVAAHRPAGTEAHVGGTSAVFADISAVVDKDLRVVFPVAAVLIGLILLLLLRSLLAPLVLLLAVGLGFAATLGASALVFQHALEQPGVAFTLPLILFLFVVALGTDYNILVTDRIREEMERPGPARAAVARAVRHTAPAVATAGVVLAASFGSLAVNPASATQQIGFATGLGILLSAFVLSIVLVPACAVLLGRSLWWPARPRPEEPRRDPAGLPEGVLVR